MRNFDFSRYLEKERDRSREVCSEYLDDIEDLSKHYPAPYLELLKHIHQPYLLAGGKWARALLVRLSYGLLSKPREGSNIYLGSVAIEMLHRYILNHDDLIDQDLMRHGEKTLEAVYQDRLDVVSPPYPMAMYAKGYSMIGGDVINTLVYDAVLKTGFDTTVNLTVVRGIGECFRDTVAGWTLETELKQSAIDKVTGEQVEKVMHFVSGLYSVVWPLRFGQLFAGQQYGDWNQSLETYGMNIGLAFQMQDDLLAIFGDQENTGKPVGNDLREGKKTLLLLKAYAKASENDRNFLKSTLGKEVTMVQLEEVKGIMKRTGAYKELRDYSKKLVSNGVDALRKLPKALQSSSSVGRLLDLGEYLADREM